MKSDIFFKIGVAMILVRVFNTIILELDIADPIISGTGDWGLLFLLSAIYLRIDEHLKSKTN
tara:strand:+ start:180 stop:365 length:186 start_codon:yes stop_codon:yes gene_type:complete